MTTPAYRDWSDINLQREWRDLMGQCTLFESMLNSDDPEDCAHLVQLETKLKAVEAEIQFRS